MYEQPALVYIEGHRTWRERYSVTENSAGHVALGLCLYLNHYRAYRQRRVENQLRHIDTGGDNLTQ